jgi:hypothetical protein
MYLKLLGHLTGMLIIYSDDAENVLLQYLCHKCESVYTEGPQRTF